MMTSGKYHLLTATEPGQLRESAAARDRDFVSLLVKRFIKVGLTAFIIYWLFSHPPLLLPIATGSTKPTPESQRVYEQPQNDVIRRSVDDILRDHPLIDGHNDFPIFLRSAFNNHIYNKAFVEAFENGNLPLHVDLARLRAGKSGGAFWSVFTPCPQNGSDFSDGNYAQSIRDTLQQIDVITRLKEAYPSDFSPMLTSRGSLVSWKDKRQLISPLGVEGLHQIGNSVANLRRYYALGVRYATLTHNCHNRFADAALLENPFRKAEPLWGGVSPEGRRLVREMNRLGMIVDLAHASEQTMVDVLGGNSQKPSSGSAPWEGSLAPVIFSHSSAYSLCPHPRNVKDHVLELVKRRNSLVMINFSPDFISCVANDDNPSSGLPKFYPANATISHVTDHIMHIGKLIGYDHVGLGSDFDGIASTPRGLEDVSKFPDLVAELVQRGVQSKDIAKVVGRNILRVWGEVEAVAMKMQAEGEPPLEDDLPSLIQAEWM